MSWFQILLGVGLISFFLYSVDGAMERRATVSGKTERRRLYMEFLECRRPKVEELERRRLNTEHSECRKFQELDPNFQELNNNFFRNSPFFPERLFWCFK